MATVSASRRCCITAAMGRRASARSRSRRARARGIEYSSKNMRASRNAGDPTVKNSSFCAPSACVARAQTRARMRYACTRTHARSMSPGRGVARRACARTHPLVGRGLGGKRLQRGLVQAREQLAQALAAVVCELAKEARRFAEVAEPQAHFLVVGGHGERAGALLAFKLVEQFVACVLAGGRLFRERQPLALRRRCRARRRRHVDIASEDPQLHRRRTCPRRFLRTHRTHKETRTRCQHTLRRWAGSFDAA